ncbi:MAG TPA: tRNA (adenosine(37)-N6)-threonylcarbamoyltransferase complex dimerization subunit type 1 TsaB [Cyanobacteria bacterium UBA9971]|nr:tRNA (adenosine(37)-N6)-threonylcarbamoyltransferase complex dimerization subunit type 1 TsaB [Cyanobacteria bacterium UBA9971]
MFMKILTFDTSTETMYVTIGNDSNILAHKIIETTQKSYNSAHLIPVIIELLQSLNLTMRNIEAIGVNIGPGSFTGIRASATVAKVMAQQLNIPVVGISSMEIYSLLNNTAKDTLIWLDARRGKAYMAVYGEKILEPQAIEYENAVEYAKNNDLFIISDKKMSEIVKEAGLKTLNLAEIKENFGLFLAKLTYKHLHDITVIARSGLRAEAEVAAKPPRNAVYGEQPSSKATWQSQSSEFKWHDLKPLYIQPPPISMPKVK